MSFDKRNIIFGRGITNNFATPKGLITHTYFSNDDNQATISAGGYFSDFLGGTADDVIANDILLVRDSASIYRTYKLDTVSPIAVTLIETGTPANPFDQNLNTTDNPSFVGLTLTSSGILTAATGDFSTGVTIQSGGAGLQLPTTGETPTLLNFYKEFTDASFTFSSSPWASSQSIILRADRMNERVTIRLNNASASANTSDFIQSSDVLPTWLRPSEDSWCALPVINNGNQVIGRAKVTTGGLVQIFSDQPDGNFDTPSTAGWNTSTIVYYIQDS